MPGKKKEITTKSICKNHKENRVLSNYPHRLRKEQGLSDEAFLPLRAACLTDKGAVDCGVGEGGRVLFYSA